MASQILVKGLCPTNTGGYTGKTIGTRTPNPLTQTLSYMDQMQLPNLMQNTEIYYLKNFNTVVLTNHTHYRYARSKTTGECGIFQPFG
jgi:hypothetical protein